MGWNVGGYCHDGCFLSFSTRIGIREWFFGGFDGRFGHVQANVISMGIVASFRGLHHELGVAMGRNTTCRFILVVARGSTIDFQKEMVEEINAESVNSVSLQPRSYN